MNVWTVFVSTYCFCSVNVDNIWLWICEINVYHGMWIGLKSFKNFPFIIRHLEDFHIDQFSKIVLKRSLIWNNRIAQMNTWHVCIMMGIYRPKSAWVNVWKIIRQKWSNSVRIYLLLISNMFSSKIMWSIVVFVYYDISDLSGTRT
jgi:hypothetical protein